MGSCGTKASSKDQANPVVVVRPVQRNYAQAEPQEPNPVQVPEQPNDQQHAQPNPADFQANGTTSHEQHPQQQPGIVEQQRPEMARIDLAKAKIVEPERHATDDEAEEMFAQNMRINANAKPQLQIDAGKQENKDHPVFALNFPMGGEDSPGHNQTPLAYRNRADSPTVEQKVVIKNRDKKVTDIINNPDESDDSMASPMYDRRIGNEDDGDFDVMNQGNGGNHFGHYDQGRPTSGHK